MERIKMRGQLSDKTHRLIGLQHIFNSGDEL